MQSLELSWCHMNKYYVYIIASPSGTLYTGVTGDLERRVFEHKNKLIPGSSSKYNIRRLVYYEESKDIKEALNREKQIKSWRRNKKVDLITSSNPKWQDLSEGWHETGKQLTEH
jgi:putative endonuclease